jgi:hypothetical protein
MMEWMRRYIERRREEKKLKLSLAFSGEGAFKGGGRISVDINRLIQSPQFQAQVQAIERLRSESPDGTITIDLGDPNIHRFLGPEIKVK